VTATPETAVPPLPDEISTGGVAPTGRGASGRSIWRRARTAVWRSSSVLAVLAAWQVLAMALDNVMFLPRLEVIAVEAVDLYREGTLMPDLLISLQRALLGFAIAAVAGTLIGLAMGWFRTFETLMSPLVSLTYPVPKIGLIPLLILWFGVGEASKIAVIVAAAIYPVIINVHAGVKSIDKRLLWRAQTLGAGKIEVFLRVVIPATLPTVFLGLRLAMGLSWILLFAAEMVASNEGLGHMIIRAQQLFQTPTVFVALIVIGVLGFLFDVLVMFVARRSCRWHFERSAAALSQ
jgi:ABC-type nitrate/sulfonate/bicarbonate transport system permease component